MKSLLLLSTLLIVSIVASAQQASVQIPFLPAAPKIKGLKPVLDPTHSLANAYKKQLTRSPGYPNPNWYCYAWDWANINAAEPDFYSMPLFPDTNIIASFFDTLGKRIPEYPNFHGAAVIVDPDNFQYTPWDGSPYTIDSIEIQGTYIRTTADSIVDTLVITLFKSNNVDYATLINTPPPDDTVWWKVVSYDALTNSIWDSVQYQVFKYPLTVKDSTGIAFGSPLFVNNVKPVFIALTNPIPLIDSPNVIGMSVEFIPGYSYSLANNDSLGGVNSYNLLTSAEMSSLDQQVNTFGNFNYSYVLTTELRYQDDDSDSFNGQYYPSIGLASFGGQNHLMFVHLTPNPLGINQVMVSNGLNFYPNPTRDAANLEYNLKNNAKEVSLKVFDLTGKQLMDIENTSLAAGTHSIPISTETFARGLYFYSLTIDGQPLNGKFIVQ